MAYEINTHIYKADNAHRRNTEARSRSHCCRAKVICIKYSVCVSVYIARKTKNRWEGDVKNDITRMKITNWKDCIKDRTKWKTLVEKAKTSLRL